MDETGFQVGIPGGEEVIVPRPHSHSHSYSGSGSGSSFGSRFRGLLGPELTLCTRTELEGQLCEELPPSSSGGALPSGLQPRPYGAAFGLVGSLAGYPDLFGFELLGLMLSFLSPEVVSVSSCMLASNLKASSASACVLL